MIRGANPPIPICTHQLLEIIRNHSRTDYVQAAVTYTLRKERHEHPSGSFDAARRWYPDESEDLDISGLRPPSRAWPFSYMLSARTAKHCAHLLGAKTGNLLKLSRLFKAAGNDVRALLRCLPPAEEADIAEFLGIDLDGGPTV